MISGDGWESVLLDRGGFKLRVSAWHLLQEATLIADLDTVENLGVEHVDTGVDSVSDELDWLFDKSVNNCRSWLGDDDTVVGWLGDLCDLDRSVLRQKERKKLRELTMMDPSQP
jgi:hypothetical protein